MEECRQVNTMNHTELLNVSCKLLHRDRVHNLAPRLQRQQQNRGQFQGKYRLMALHSTVG